MRPSHDDGVRPERINDDDLAVYHDVIESKLAIEWFHGGADFGRQNNFRIWMNGSSSIDECQHRFFLSTGILVGDPMHEKLFTIEGDDIVEKGTFRTGIEHQEQNALARAVD